MSSIFEVLFLFWFVVVFLLSSWDDMDVCVELLLDDAWAAEDDKTSFLSVGVDILDQLNLKERPISLPKVLISAKKRKYEKWGQVRKLTKSKYDIFSSMIKIICFVIPPFMEKLEKSRNINQLILINVQNILFDRPFFI